MPRYSKSEIEKHRASLEAWRTPSEMIELCRDMMDYLGSADLFNQPGLGFIREGWAAATFAQARDANIVRLVAEKERWPDFELRVGGLTDSWEIYGSGRAWSAAGSGVSVRCAIGR